MAEKLVQPTFDLAGLLDQTRRLYEPVRLGRAGWDAELIEFVAAAALATRAARHKREDYFALLEAGGVKLTEPRKERVELGIMCLATGEPINTDSSMWARAAAYVAEPPGGEAAGSLQAAVAFIKASRGVRELANKQRARYAAHGVSEPSEAEQPEIIEPRQSESDNQNTTEAEWEWSIDQADGSRFDGSTARGELLANIELCDSLLVIWEETVRDRVVSEVKQFAKLVAEFLQVEYRVTKKPEAEEAEAGKPIPWQRPPACRVCGRNDLKLTKSGNISHHKNHNGGMGRPGIYCPGSGQPPKAVDAPAPAMSSTADQIRERVAKIKANNPDIAEGICPVCGELQALTAKGKIANHNCTGAGREPVKAEPVSEAVA